MKQLRLNKKNYYVLPFGWLCVNFKSLVITDRYCFHGLALSCLKVASVSALCKPFAERWDGDDPQLSIPLIFLASAKKIRVLVRVINSVICFTLLNFQIHLDII